jgi:phage shock protein A
VQWAAQKDATEKLKTALHQLNDKIEEARRKKNLLIARSKRAEAQKRIHNTMSGLTDKGAFDTFDRMAAKVEQTEAEGLASVELAVELSGADLDSQFKQLEATQGDDLLAELKAKMGAGKPAPALAAKATAVEEDEDPLDAELARLKALTEGRMPVADLQEVGSRETVPAKS